MPTTSPQYLLIALGKKLQELEKLGTLMKPGILLETDYDFKILVTMASTYFWMLDQNEMVSPLSYEDLTPEFNAEVDKVAAKYLA